MDKFKKLIAKEPSKWLENAKRRKSESGKLSDKEVLMYVIGFMSGNHKLNYTKKAAIELTDTLIGNIERLDIERDLSNRNIIRTCKCKGGAKGRTVNEYWKQICEVCGNVSK